MTKTAAITIWFNGRLACYPGMGMLTTSSASCEITKSQMVLVMALLDARGAFVSRLSLLGALDAAGLAAEDVAGVSVHLSLLRRRFDDAKFPLLIHSSHSGQGVSLTWAGEAPANGKAKPQMPRIPADERAPRRPAPANSEAPPVVIRQSLPDAMRMKIFELRNKGGKDKGWSVGAIAKHLSIPPNEVAGVLGVMWGGSGL